MRVEAAATCTGVVKIYWSASGEVHALKGVDAVCGAGAITAIVGPSGSGKSSLLRILAAMDRPTAGSVLLGGAEIGNVPPRRLHGLRRRLIGYVFQRPSENLMPHLTVQQHLDVAARLRGSSGPHTAELLELLGMGDRAHHRPAQLSGGEQQRVAFARAVVGDPLLVVADEPTAELDGESTDSVMEAVRLLADRGSAVVVATHDPAVVAKADATLALRHGAMEFETRAARSLAVIDDSGRVQLPADAVEHYPERRAVLRHHGDGRIEITPPSPPSKDA